MPLFGYQILELESIPREKAVLRAMIIDAQRRQWRAAVSRLLAIICVVIGFVMLFSWGPLRAEPIQTDTILHRPGMVLYLPVLSNQ